MTLTGHFSSEVDPPFVMFVLTEPGYFKGDLGTFPAVFVAIKGGILSQTLMFS